MYKITKRFTFDASHRLWDDNLTETENYTVFGKCANLPSHGHTYIVEITLKGETLKHGMVVNFNEIKKVYKEQIEEKFDHHFLNDVVPFLTTAENLSKHFYEILKESFPETYKIKIYETPTSWVEYSEK